MWYINEILCHCDGRRKKSRLIFSINLAIQINPDPTRLVICIHFKVFKAFYKNDKPSNDHQITSSNHIIKSHHHGVFAHHRHRRNNPNPNRKDSNIPNPTIPNPPPPLQRHIPSRTNGSTQPHPPRQLPPRHVPLPLRISQTG